MSRHTISLPDQLTQYVSERISSGNFTGINDYIRDLIRNDQRQKEVAFVELRELIHEGKKGEGVPFSIDEIIKSAEKKMGV